MEYAELHEAVNSLVDELSEAAPREGWSSVTHLLHYGQEDEAMDVLVAILVRYNVPVTRIQHETVRRLMAEFEFTDESRPNYAYLSDSEMLDRMTVVDESS